MRATSSTRSTSRVDVERGSAARVTSRPSAASATVKPSASRMLRLRAAAAIGVPEQPLDARLAQAQRRRGSRSGCGVDVDRARHERRAGQLDHQPGGDGLRLHRLAGRELLLEARRRLRAQAEPRRRALDVRADPGRRLHQHARRALVDLGAVAAHHAGDRRRAGGVVDHDHLAVERALDLVERDDLLAGSARARTTSVPPSTRSASKACSGWPVEQHHVVGDVDDVVDRPLPGGHQARLQPRRRRADRDVLEARAG